MNFAAALNACRLCVKAYAPDAQRVGPAGIAIEREDNTLRIAFSGTENFRDWFTDGKFVLAKWPSWPGLIHDGFGRDAEDVYSALFAARILPQPETPVNIELSGHSLGAARAVLVAWRLLDFASYRVKSIITFGCPRIGNHTFADVVTRSLLPPVERIINGGDWVAHNPIWPFWHVGMGHYFDTAGFDHDHSPYFPFVDWSWKWHHIDRSLLTWAENQECSRTYIELLEDVSQREAA